MAEWLKAHAWKACVRETVPWVRIPLSPPCAIETVDYFSGWSELTPGTDLSTTFSEACKINQLEHLTCRRSAALDSKFLVRSIGQNPSLTMPTLEYVRSEIEHMRS